MQSHPNPTPEECDRSGPKRAARNTELRERDEEIEATRACVPSGKDSGMGAAVRRLAELVERYRGGRVGLEREEQRLRRALGDDWVQRRLA